MAKSKKGISPLIATVLILGFTVALAAVIMTWGTKFVRDTQESTSQSATANVACAQEVTIEIDGVCKVGATTTYMVTVSNDGTKDINSFKIRLYKDQNNVQSIDNSSSITSFGVGQLTAAGTLSSVKKVEVIPTITVEGRLVTCASNVANYGDLSGIDITNAC